MEIIHFVPKVAPYVVDCPAGVLHAAIRRAVGQLLRETEIWRESIEVEHDAFAEDGALDVAGLVPADGRTLVRVVAVKREPEAYLDFHMIGAQLFLPYKPHNGSFSLQVVYGATDALSVYPEALRPFMDGVADLALFLICSVPRRPYTNPGQARDALARYEVAREQAKHFVLTGYGSGEIVNPLPEYF